MNHRRKRGDASDDAPRSRQASGTATSLPEGKARRVPEPGPAEIKLQTEMRVNDIPLGRKHLFWCPSRATPVHSHGCPCLVGGKEEQAESMHYKWMTLSEYQTKRVMKKVVEE